jgi:hypothetical protein
VKFGIFYIVQWHESRTQAQALREALEQIELADQLGIDRVSTASSAPLVSPVYRTRR